MAEVVYVLCAATSVICALLLFRGYWATRTKLLFWSSLCFFGLAINNGVLLIDRVLYPTLDLWLVRTIPAVMGITALLFGLIWESK